MPRVLRLFLVGAVVHLWPIMPRRARLWAFLNDDMPEE